MAGSETLTAPSATRGRTLNITLWVIQVLLAALFAFAGINKLAGVPQEVLDQFARFGLGPWFLYLTGALELAGAIGLLIPTAIRPGRARARRRHGGCGPRPPVRPPARVPRAGAGRPRLRARPDRLGPLAADQGPARQARALTHHSRIHTPGRPRPGFEHLKIGGVLTMRFMVLIKANKNTEAGVMPDEELLTEMGKYNEELVKAGVMLAGEGLHPSSKGARGSGSPGAKRTVIDGPFAETKELIAGFWLWQVKSKEEAIRDFMHLSR